MQYRLHLLLVFLIERRLPYFAFSLYEQYESDIGKENEPTSFAFWTALSESKSIKYFDDQCI